MQAAGSPCTLASRRTSKQRRAFTEFAAMINFGSVVFFVIMGLGAGFMVWVLWKIAADERRRHRHHIPIRRY